MNASQRVKEFLFDGIVKEGGVNNSGRRCSMLRLLTMEDSSARG